MKKFTILGGLMALALVIGMGASSFGAGKAEAKVKDVITFNPDVCFTLTGAVAPDLDDFQNVVDDNFQFTSPTSGFVEPEVFADFYGSFNCYGLTDVLAHNGPPVLGYLVSWAFIVGDFDDDGDFTDPGETILGETFVDSWFALNAIADLMGGDVDDPDTYAALVDASAGQLGDESYVHFYEESFDLFNAEFAGLIGFVDGTGIPLATINSQTMWVVAFPSSDDAVDFSADEGVFLSSREDTSEVLTPPFDFTLPFEDLNNHHEFATVDLLLSGCTTHDVDDLRCGPEEAHFDRTDMDLGAQQITAVEEDSDVEVTLDYTVVGHPENIALTALKTTIQEDSGADCSLADVADEIGLPDVTLLIAKITDNDKTALTGLWVLWTAADDNDVGGASNQLKLAVPADVSIHSAAGDAAVNLACGDATGAGEVHAGVWMPQDAELELAPGFFFDAGGPFLLAEMDFDDTHPTDVVDITVIGAPATFSLAASPASIVCNGTNSAVVTVTVLNSAGKPVVAGVPVTFDVVALGTANPINTVTDANGVAKSTITPIGNVTAGVTVIVTVDDLGAQSVVVGCQAQALPTAAPPPPIVGPNTGDGGYLP